MKKMLTFFGVLDIISVVDGILFHNLLFREISLNPFDIEIISMYVSLVLSGYFLIRQKEIGLWISYIQFPFRLLFEFFSFGFLFLLNYQHYLPVLFLTAVLIILEIGRLILSIFIHRRYFKKSMV